MQTTNPESKNALKQAFLFVLAIAAGYNFLSALRGALLLWMAGGAIGAGQGATIGAVVFGFLASFIFGTIVLTFILCIAGFMGIMLYSLFGNVAKKKGGENHDADKSNAALKKFFTYAFLTDVALAAIVSGYGTFVQFGIADAAGANVVLNLLAAVLTFVLSLVSFTVVFGFIGGVALIIFGVIAWLFTGGMSRPANGGNPTDGGNAGQ